MKQLNLTSSQQAIIRIFALIIVLFCAFTARVAFAETSTDAQEQIVLVRFAADSTEAERNAVIAGMGGELVSWLPQIQVAEVRLAQVGLVGAGEEAVMASVAGVSGQVVNIEMDSTVAATYAPIDPDFSDATMSYGFHDIQAFDAWDVETGSPAVIIAVLDSGVQLAHPEFAGRLVDGYDFVNDDADPSDDSGHGTHVAGIIAAALDNGQGVAGVCPNCRIMPVKVLNKFNLGSWTQLAKGIIFAVDNGASVINLSLGSGKYSEIVNAAVEYAVERGVVVVAAAGNNGSDAPFYPAALDGVIGVGATTSTGERWAKSDFGSQIDLFAPGDLIYSTFHEMNNMYRGYTYMSGTSMAAPFVSGVAGLLLSAAPELSASEVTEAMILGADDLGAVGWDAEFGHGRVNAMGALKSPVQNLMKAMGTENRPEQAVAMVFLPSVGK